MAEVEQVAVREPVARYVLRVVHATRTDDAVALGASPRAALAWLRAARAAAWIEGRDHVLPDDLKALARPVLAHRLVLEGGGDAGDWIDQLITRVNVPL